MTCFGSVNPELDEPVFHFDWERRVRGLVGILINNRYNWDEFRFALERIEPAIYLSSSYYERWLTGLERYMIEQGVITIDELRSRTAGAAPKPGLACDVGFDDAKANMEFAIHDLNDNENSNFGPGDTILVRNMNPCGHTRLPHYVRGKRGTIDRYLGMQTLPDTNAHRLGLFQQPVYSVKFKARDLWGERASELDSVYLDLWETYFEGVSD